MASDNRELRFHDAMLNIYKRAKKEAGYTMRIFLGHSWAGRRKGGMCGRVNGPSCCARR